jgi:hypothetical protein
MGRKYNKSTGRSYVYDTKYESSPQQKKNRAQRNAARRKLIAQGRVHVGDHKDVGHLHGLKKGNKAGNLRVQSHARNRGYKRKGGHLVAY